MLAWWGQQPATRLLFRDLSEMGRDLPHVARGAEEGRRRTEARWLGLAGAPELAEVRADSRAEAPLRRDDP
ncbi:hypothetical protein GCM10027517_18860 [Phycicoccus ginsengisoli]